MKDIAKKKKNKEKVSAKEKKKIDWIEFLMVKFGDCLIIEGLLLLFLTLFIFTMFWGRKMKFGSNMIKLALEVKS